MDIFTVKQWLLLLILADCVMIYFLMRVADMCRILLIQVDDLLTDVRGHE